MRILPISNNFYKTQPVKTSSQPNFQGGLNQSEMNRVIKMLAEKNTGIIEKLSIEPEFINKIATGFIEKYRTRSVGLQIISGQDLVKFLGNNTVKHNPTNKVGLCIAVGDKFGPIESWNQVYEAKTVLIPESSIMQANHWMN